MELRLNSVSAENRSGHSGLQESCCVEEVSQGREGACQVSQLESNSEGNITRGISMLMVLISMIMVLMVRAVD